MFKAIVVVCSFIFPHGPCMHFEDEWNRLEAHNRGVQGNVKKK